MVTQRQPNDCVVTALANYTGKTYDEVHTLLEKVRAEDEGNGNGYWIPTYLFALTCLVGKHFHYVTHTPVNGIVRFRNNANTMGHLVAMRGGLILDGSCKAITQPVTLEQYLETLPYLEKDQAWE